MNNTVILTPKQAREYRLQVSDLTSASEQPEINRSRYARTCDLVNVSMKTAHVTDAQVIAYYEKRYGVTPVATPITAGEAEQRILAANVPYSYVREMTKDGNLTDVLVDERIAKYFADKAEDRARSQRKLARLHTLLAVQA